MLEVPGPIIALYSHPNKSSYAPFFTGPQPPPGTLPDVVTIRDPFTRLTEITAHGSSHVTIDPTPMLGQSTKLPPNISADCNAQVIISNADLSCAFNSEFNTGAAPGPQQKRSCQ